MNEDSKICGVAWRYCTPSRGSSPTIDEYNAFVGRPDAVLKIVLKGGIVQAELPLLMIPNFGLWEDQFYVFPELLRAGDIERWSAPKEVLLRLSIQGEGYFGLVPTA
jgi:hypothetical protein